MNRFVAETAAPELVNKTKDISATLQLFGLKETGAPYFISEGIAVTTYPQEGFRADYYIYAICLSGTATISLNGEKIRLKKNDFFTAIPSSAIQVFECSDSFRAKVLLFQRSFLLKNIADTRQLEQLGYFNYDTMVHVPLHNEEASFLKQKLDTLGVRSKMDSLFQDTIMQSLMINLLFETAEIYFRYRGEVKRKALNNEELLFVKFTSLLQTHFITERQLDFYANKLFVTDKYLIEICKKVAGKTPGTLIAEAVLAEAKLLLTLPDQNISTVSTELQYSSVAAFSKFFKKHTGIAPKDYKAK